MSQKIFRVLVADDDPTICLLMPAALAGDHFAVTVVDNGASALTEFNRAPFDIVLLDVEMPEMDGFEVGAAIRRSHGQRVRLVLVSGHDDQAFFERAAALGADHIAKPVNWSAIAGQLLELLDGDERL